MRCGNFFDFKIELNLLFQFGVMEGRPVNRTSDRPLMSLFFTFKKVIVCVIWEAIVCHKMYWKLGCNWRAPVLVAPSAKKTPPPLSGCVLRLTFYFYTMHILTQRQRKKKYSMGFERAWENHSKFIVPSKIHTPMAQDVGNADSETPYLLHMWIRLSESGEMPVLVGTVLCGRTIKNLRKIRQLL